MQLQTFDVDMKIISAYLMAQFPHEKVAKDRTIENVLTMKLIKAATEGSKDILVQIFFYFDNEAALKLCS